MKRIPKQEPDPSARPNVSLAVRYPSSFLCLLSLVVLAGCASLVTYQRMESASSHFRNGNYRRAADGYTAVIEADSDYKQAYYFRALSRVRLGEVEPALRDVNRLLDRDPASVDGLQLKGDLLHWQGQYDAARKHYDHVLDVKPAPESARTLEARGLLSYQVLDHDRAVEDFESILGMDGVRREQKGRADLYLALIYFEEGVNRQAHVHLDAARDRLGTSSWRAGYHLIRGAVQLEEGGREAGRRGIERAVELNPGVVEYLLDRIADKYRRSAVESPYSPDWFFRAAQSFERRGQPGTADRLAHHALAENPDSRAYQRFLGELDGSRSSGGETLTWQTFLMESYPPE